MEKRWEVAARNKANEDAAKVAEKVLNHLDRDGVISRAAVTAFNRAWAEGRERPSDDEIDAVVRAALVD